MSSNSLKIKKASSLGFCFGVKRAYQTVKKEHGKYGQPVFILGDLVHNRHVAQELQDWGIKKIDNPKSVQSGTLIIPSHGTSPQTLRKLRNQSVRIVNTTCPRVSFVIGTARALKKEKRPVLIFGDKNHTEIRAINESIENSGLIFSNLAELKKLLQTQKLASPGLISQTTQNLDQFRQAGALILAKHPGAKIIDTICPATQKRQQAALALIPETDVILVIGSPQSANSNRLAQIIARRKSRLYFIDNAQKIEKQWFRAGDRVGLTAGASTPSHVIRSVVKTLQNLKP